MRIRTLTAAAVAVALLAGCASAAPTPSPTAPPATPSTVEPRGPVQPAGDPVTIATGLTSPWSVVPLDGGGALVSQRDDGAVREVTATGEVRVAGTVPGVVSGGESGLHGLALRPVGDEPMLYAYFGAADDNRVVRMPLLGEPGGYELGPAEVILEGIPRASTHDGGRLAFGPDGFLYVTTGDAQQGESAQDVGRLAVRQALDQHQGDGQALVLRQPRELPLHLGGFKTAFGRRCAVVADPLAGLLRREDDIATLPRAGFVDPGVLHDPKHPTVETRPDGPLTRPRQGPLDRELDQIVGVRRALGQTEGEAVQGVEVGEGLRAEVRRRIGQDQSR